MQSSMKGYVCPHGPSSPTAGKRGLNRNFVQSVLSFRTPDQISPGSDDLSSEIINDPAEGDDMLPVDSSDPLLAADDRPRIVRLEYTAITRASRAQAWEIFSDLRHWKKFSNIYGDIHWFAGRPWKPGSRLRISLLQPVKTTVDHVITVCRPEEFVAWIDHCLGNTMEQCVSFRSQPDGTTCVHTWAELTGTTSHLDGKHFGDLVKDFIERWYRRFCRECDRVCEEEYAIG